MTGNTTHNDRGQVGIGTLIVFIALVLVAAVAAGVLLNTSDLLQERAQQTSQESTQEVSDRLIVQNVFAAAGDDGSGNTVVNNLTLSVRKASGSSNVDVSFATVEYFNDDSGSQATLTYSDSASVGVFTLQDTVGVSNQVFDDEGDRGDLFVDTSSNSTTPTRLSPGESARLVVVTASGAETTVEIKVPNNLVQGEVYEVGDF